MPTAKLVATALMVLAWCGPVRAQAISEETPPATCGNKLVTGITCTGRYCDNMEAICGTGRRELYDIRWSKFVSEEGAAVAQCTVPNPFERGDWPAGEPAFISGFACNGRYCDNIALECVALKDAFPATFGGPSCQWTSWVSEETPSLRFPPGFGAISMACRGKYCDDKRFLVCPLMQR